MGLAPPALRDEAQSMTIQELVLAISVLMVIVLIASLANPKRLVSSIATLPSVPRFRLAVIVRLLFGGLLALAAPQCHLPWLIYSFAGLAVIAAIGIFFAGRTRLDRLVIWFDAQPVAGQRVWAGFGLAMAALPVYAVGV